MKKKQYLQPQSNIVAIHFESLLEDTSLVHKVNSNVNMNYGGGSSNVARGREASDWFDDEE